MSLPPLAAPNPAPRTPGPARRTGDLPLSLPVRITGAVVLAVSTVVFILTMVVRPGGPVYLLDLDVYRGGARLVLDGGDLYGTPVPVRFGTLPFTYPPLAALLFIPLALLPEAVAGLATTAVTCLCLAVTVAVTVHALAREAGTTLPRRDVAVVSVLALPVLVWSHPVLETFGFGQVNVVLMAVVAVDLLLPRTPWPRGALIGLAAAVKLTPAVFVLVLLLRRRWQAAAVAAGTGLGASALVWLVLPADSTAYWFGALGDPGRIGRLEYAANQSLRGVVARTVSGGDDVQSVVWVVASLGVAVLVVAAMVRLLRRGAVTAAVVANALLALLVSPVSWSHHWVWVVPMLLVTGAAAVAGRGAVPVVLGCVVALVATVAPVHVFLPSGDGVERTWPPLLMILGSEYPLVGIAWLVAAVAAPRAFLPGPRRAAPAGRASGAPESTGPATGEAASEELPAETHHARRTVAEPDT
ncbi:glycosyltransferase 87 family protein [Corynebacterium bovis]|uniref:glycosyltransferase 87 family protein n=1 Tax=Corynebacterium bovis TaxID=36808 RepID=UPI003139A9FF